MKTTVNKGKASLPIKSYGDRTERKEVTRRQRSNVKTGLAASSAVSRKPKHKGLFYVISWEFFFGRGSFIELVGEQGLPKRLRDRMEIKVLSEALPHEEALKLARKLRHQQA